MCMYSSRWYNSFYYNEHCDTQFVDSGNIDFTDLLMNNDQDYPELGSLSQLTDHSLFSENEGTISKIGSCARISYTQVINICTSVVSTIQANKVHMEKLFTAMEYLISILRKGNDFDIEVSSVSRTKNTSIQTSYGSSYNSIIHNKAQMKRKQSSRLSNNDPILNVKKSRNINQ